MRIGDLDTRVTIQQKIVTTDPEGLVTETWNDIATVWANLRGLRGREFFQAAAVNAENTVMVTIRYRPGITTGMRLKYTALDGIEHVLDIYHVNPVGRRRWLELACREVT